MDYRCTSQGLGCSRGIWHQFRELWLNHLHPHCLCLVKFWKFKWSKVCCRNPTCLEQESPPASTGTPPLVTFVTTGLSLPLSRAAGAWQVWNKTLPCPALLWPCWGLAQGGSPPLPPGNTSLPPLLSPRVWHLVLKVGLKSCVKSRSRYSSYWQGSSFRILRNHRDLPSKLWGHSDGRSFKAPYKSLPVFVCQGSLKYSANRHCRLFMIHGSWYPNYSTLC